ncbi:hypothetical protein NHJ13051_004759 [Beauveria bassiana]
MQFATLLMFVSAAAAAAVPVDDNAKVDGHVEPAHVERSPCWWDGKLWHDCAK